MKEAATTVLKNSSCACCGGTGFSEIHSGLTSVYTERPYSVAECHSCKNMITLPVPDKSTLDEIYNKTYLYPVHLLALNEKKFRSVSLSKYIIKNFTPGKYKTVIEAGCMYGYLLDCLKSDYQVKGIEIGNDAVEYCKAKGLDVIDTSIENYLAQKSESFDIIILSHVFEHLSSPGIILEQLARRLNPGGKIILCVPNSDSICRKLFGRYWGWWQVPVHINHFRESAMKEIAAKKGLKVDAIRYKGGDSLMLLLNLINIFGFRGKNSSPGIFQRMVIFIFTTFFRYWYYIGNEESTVVLSKK